MSENYFFTFTAIFIFLLVFLSVGALSLSVKKRVLESQVISLQVGAVERGAGEWVVNKDGKAVFYLIEKN